MNKEWELLTLDGYLTYAGLPPGVTFSRTLPSTSLLPEVTVGLGLIRPSNRGFFAELIPKIRHITNATVNTFINEVAERYLQLSEISENNWQELLLLDLGYVRKAFSTGNNPTDKNNLFSSLLLENNNLPLLEKHGFHKIATLLAYDCIENIEETLEILDELNKELPEYANYGTLLNLFSIGVPVEDFHLAVQLPEDMVRELYG